MAREELSARIHSAQSTQNPIRYIKVVPSFYSYCVVGEERGRQQLAVGYLREDCQVIPLKDFELTSLVLASVEDNRSDRCRGFQNTHSSIHSVVLLQDYILFYLRLLSC